MASFGKKSEERIATLHPDLRKVLRHAIKITDFSVLCGLRSKADQQRAVEQKRSFAKYPESKHNRSLRDDGSWNSEISDAVDLAPYPVLWPGIQDQTTVGYARRLGRFYLLAGVVLACAMIEGVKLRWGGHFKSIFDGPHFERVTDE
jgi:peptidoglycan L-alanyl-D-glutamate endopeptidase CwlK